MLEEIITDHGAVVFNGDGYSEDWQIEAEARGLPNLRTTRRRAARAHHRRGPWSCSSHYGVFNDREMHSRYEIALEQYALSVGVEARLDARDRPTRRSCPAALRYQTELATNVGRLKAIGFEFDTSTLDEVSRGDRGRSRRPSPRCARSSATRTPTTCWARPAHAGDGLLPAMAAVRAAADELEGLVADDLWPLATYQEMLFIL